MSKKYIFQNPDPNDVVIKKLVLQNDIYMKYEIYAKVEGEMICSAEENSSRRPEKKKLKKETYQEYLESIKKIPLRNVKWIYNIIDGVSEQEDIIYSDDKFILIPTFEWDKKNIFKTHILAIVKDKKLRSIRSLTEEHVELLEHILNTSLKHIESTYKIPKENFRTYIHYYPSTWHLHIHFNLIENKEHAYGIDCAHELHQVIFNLKMCSKYYQKTDMHVVCY